MPRLTLLVGPPGSGKSTLAKEYCSLGGAVYINQDSQGKNHHNLFGVAIAEGKDVVVDRLNFSKGQRDRYLSLAKANGYSTHITVLHQPYKVCLERCLARQGHETIKDEDNARAALSMFFGKYERVQDNEADVVLRVWPEGDKPVAIICDLDGTLCKIDHRLHFVRREPGVKKDWKGFFDAMDGDDVNEWCARLLHMMGEKLQIVYCSGRPDDRRRQTRSWLEKRNLFDLCYGNLDEQFHLYMRPRNDSRQDNIVKEIILDFEILTRFTPYFMIDDRKQVVDMWRARGFTCLHCAEGDF